LSRVATATLRWEVDDSAVAASWAKIKAQVQQGLQIPLSGGAAGGGGSPVGTLGGLAAGAGTLPPAMQQMLPTASPNWSYYFGQLQNQVSSLGQQFQQPQPAPQPSPPTPGRSAMGLRLFGASLFAVHSLGGVLREEQEEDSIGEMMDRGDTAGALRTRLADVRRQRQGIGGWFRSVLSHNQGFNWSFGGEEYRTSFGWGDRFDDKKSERELRQGIALDEEGSAADQLLYRTRRVGRETSSLNLNPIDRARAEAEQSSDEARQSVKPMASMVSALRNLGLRSAADALAKTASGYTSGVDALGVARVRNQQRVINEDIEDTGAQDEIVSYRGSNRPLQAARNALHLKHDQIIRDYERTNDPRLKTARILFRDEDDALVKTQRRTATIEGADLDARNEASVALIGRNPLAARLREIEGRGVSALLRTPRDADYDANRARIGRGVALDSTLARQEDQDRQQAIGLSLTTQGIQLQRLAANNPVGAESAGIVGDAIQQANALRKQGYGALALQSLGVSGLRLDASKAAYLRSLGASDIDSRFNTTAGNVAPTPTEVLGQFAQAKAQLLGAGIANVGGRIGQFLSNIDPTGFMGGAGGGGGNGDVVRKLEETAQRFENAIKNIVSE
jgi:hypothetical protein